MGLCIVAVNQRCVCDCKDVLASAESTQCILFGRSFAPLGCGQVTCKVHAAGCKREKERKKKKKKTAPSPRNNKTKQKRGWGGETERGWRVGGGGGGGRGRDRVRGARTDQDTACTRLLTTDKANTSQPVSFMKVE